MDILSQKAKNGLRNFIAWGGLSGFTAFILQDDLLKAVIIALVIGLAVAVDKKYLDP